jgi:hypothetical protein
VDKIAMTGGLDARGTKMVPDRFGAFETIANSSIKLARVAPEGSWGVNVLVAEAI